MTERAASETMGFVLAFALVTSMIGITYASGITGLREAQRSEQVENMERAFDVLDDNVADIVQRGAPSRATEIKLAGGELAMRDSIRIHVRTNSSAPTLCNETRPLTVAPRPVSYQQDRTEIVYSGRALFRTDGNDSVMLSPPGWFNDSDRAVIPLVTTLRKGNVSQLSGHQTVLLVTRRKSQRLYCSVGQEGEPLMVTVTVESPRAEAWRRHFRDRGYDIKESTPSQVRATFNTSRLYVSDTVVEVSFTP